jgi:hypothetical protein
VGGVSAPGDLGGLRVDQAPPLAIPASFMLNAPAAMIAAGALLAVAGERALGSSWDGAALAMLHLGTLGFLLSVMLGALYQMTPVLAGAPVPWVRLAHGVHGLLVLGVALLTWGMSAYSPPGFALAGGALLLAALGFLAPIAVALARAPARTGTVAAMRLSIVALALVVALGGYLAYHRAGPGYTADWVQLRHGHGALGLVGWVGGLITGVSWQVIPMFYLTPAFPSWSQRAVLGALLVTVLAVPVVLVVHATDLAIGLATLPGAAAVWLLAPLLTLSLIARRRRKRPDASLAYWRGGLACAPAVLATGAIMMLWPDDRHTAILFAWLAIWGWAGLIVHGMLMRIVPFLVWFHRFAALVGQTAVPSMRELVPEPRARRGLALHAGTLVVGAAAIQLASPELTRITAAGLVLTGVDLAVTLVLALRFRGPTRSVA